MVNILSPSRYKINRKLLKKSATLYLEEKGISPHMQINIAFVGRQKMRDVSRTYKQEDVALPVLTFFYNERIENQSEVLLGEIVICYPQAVLLAAERNKRVNEILEWLIQHGIENLLK